MSLAVPWFMVDYQSFDLIILPNVPLKVKSIKPIQYTETTVPGDHTKPQQFVGMGPQEISFTIDLIKKSQGLGNLPVYKQFEGLRVPAFGIGTLLGLTGASNPKVLFHYGTGNFLPQLYTVHQCDFENAMYTPFGFAQKTIVSMTLKLDEKSLLYTAEKYARVALRLLGVAEGITTLVNQIASGGTESSYKGLI
jgi:hypothetical protein